MPVLFIDRRELKQDRNLENRRKFFNRIKSHLLSSIQNLDNDSISGLGSSTRNVTLKEEAIEEPHFTFSSAGIWRFVLSGNSFTKGDKLPKPPKSSGGGSGSGPGNGGDEDSEDEFVFQVNQDEFLELFFEDLALPNMKNKSILKSEIFSWQRKGYTTTGNPANMDLRRTIKNSLGRRIALNRPKLEDLEKQKDETEIQYEERVKRWKRVPYIDPIDLRFRHFEKALTPTFSAVVFFLMDVSGSMTEHHKDLAKRYFMLMYFFLQRKYTNVEIVFIRHTHHPEETDEQDFFYSTETGGTVVLTALQLVNKIIHDRFPLNEWNVYIAQASDGDCFGDDVFASLTYVEKQLLPIVQHMTYINVSDDRSSTTVSPLTKAYGLIQAENFLQAQVADKKDIFPVFRKLFSTQKEKV